MTPKSGNLQLRLQALQRQYSQELPNKIQQLESMWQQFSSQGEQQILDSLLHIAHNLTGSGAVYGYHQISKIARELEQVLTEIQESRRTPDAEEQLLIEHYIQALHLTAQKPAQSATLP